MAFTAIADIEVIVDIAGIGVIEDTAAAIIMIAEMMALRLLARLSAVCLAPRSEAASPETQPTVHAPTAMSHQGVIKMLVAGAINTLQHALRRVQLGKTLRSNSHAIQPRPGQSARRPTRASQPIRAFQPTPRMRITA